MRPASVEEGEALQHADPVRRFGIIEHEIGAAGARRDDRKRRCDRRLRQIGHDAEPGEEGRRRRIEPRLGELRVEPVEREVDRHEAHAAGDGDAGLRQPLPLPGLRRRMIDLEYGDALGRERIAIGEGIEPGAEHHDMPRAGAHGLGDPVLGQAAPRRDEGAQGGAAGRIGATDLVAGDRRTAIAADDGQRQRILEDQRPIQKLVRGPPDGRAIGGGARLSSITASAPSPHARPASCATMRRRADGSKSRAGHHHGAQPRLASSFSASARGRPGGSPRSGRISTAMLPSGSMSA